MILLSTLKPMMKKKTIEVFLLANNFHSINGSSMEEGNVLSYLDAINVKWDSYRIKLIQNGWEEVSVEYVTSEEIAEEIAWKLLNKYNPEKYL